MAQHRMPREARRNRVPTGTAVAAVVVLAGLACGAATAVGLPDQDRPAVQDPVVRIEAAPKPSAASVVQAEPQPTPAEKPPNTPGVSQTRISTEATRQVGVISDGDPADGHNCTASVVDSPGRNVIVTAAHCLSGNPYFTPGYLDGRSPYGTWRVAQTVVDPRWTKNEDEDLDVAFAVLEPLDGRQVQDVVGADRMETGRTSGPATVVGYPSDTTQPLNCDSEATPYAAHQLRVECTDFTGGTSGGPWLGDVDPDTGTGTVFGVVGGHEQGGDTADVSYSSAFDDDVAALYREAAAAS
jgi:V8-like Glu-specific endopeptidase